MSNEIGQSGFRNFNVDESIETVGQLRSISVAVCCGVGHASAVYRSVSPMAIPREHIIAPNRNHAASTVCRLVSAMIPPPFFLARRFSRALVPKMLCTNLYE